MCTHVLKLVFIIMGNIRRSADSGAVRKATVLILSNKLYSETQVYGRLDMSGGKSPRHAQIHLLSAE